MKGRGLRRSVDDLLRGRRPRPFRPDDFEAAQLRTAIDLRAARLGGDAPSQEFLTDLHRRLAAQMDDAPATGEPPKRFNATRRQVIVGTSAAAAAAVAAGGTGATIDRLVLRGGESSTNAASGGELVPNDGSWLAVARSAEVPDGVMRPFDLGSVTGFVRRVNGQAEAISGVCTHQGCRLWFDQADDQLRCPCHTTSFSPTGQVITHQLPVVPKPLPRFEVRERDGVIEVLAPNNTPMRPA
ncbi:Rieske (2Fe-2S) protein [Mycobacterium sp.]|uniref:Rieske (2Fe-2S) protein n=1 Tax=Mycobacterium sp. TaxID=1785 RepID=UPI002D3E503C|nr:Rieske (2Fe-2S) protein [Mycobacterium sp.]HZA08756.1 Rieske (2Fe-2S) protein [Mycobacterium sp.]